MDMPAHLAQALTLNKSVNLVINVIWVQWTRVKLAHQQMEIILIL
jgi:hypothetical protein